MAVKHCIITNIFHEKDNLFTRNTGTSFMLDLFEINKWNGFTTMIQKKVEELKEDVSIMARRCEAILADALRVLESGDEARMQEVLTMDQEINSLEIELDEKCMKLLALEEPYAVDFRYIFSVIKTTRDLERIADESKTIAKWSVRIAPVSLDEQFNKLVSTSKEALETAVDALIQSNQNKAESVLVLEQKTNELEDEIMATLPATGKALIVRSLERIGDHSSNIAENVIFSVKAEEIRHSADANTRNPP